jgi:hypothetical protein
MTPHVILSALHLTPTDHAFIHCRSSFAFACRRARTPFFSVPDELSFVKNIFSSALNQLRGRGKDSGRGWDGKGGCAFGMRGRVALRSAGQDSAPGPGPRAAASHNILRKFLRPLLKLFDGFDSSAFRIVELSRAATLLGEITGLQYFVHDLLLRESTTGGVKRPGHVRTMEIASIAGIVVKLAE